MYTPEIETRKETAAALERAGRWDEALAAYAGVFGEAIRTRAREPLVDALRGGARVLQPLQRLEEAEELADLSREIAERLGLPGAAARAVNILAVIRYLQRDWAGAVRLYEEALGLALSAGDDASVGLTCQNLGIVHNIQGNLREARIRYLESIGSFVRCGTVANAMLVYNNLGMLSSDMEEWLEAEVYFSRGIELAEQERNTPLLAKLFANRAEPLIATGQIDVARASLGRADELARSIDAHDTLADVARFRGSAAAAEGDLAAAAEWLERSVAIADRAQLRLERAEAERELARLRWSEGRREEAKELLRGAETVFRSLAAERDATVTAELLERWERPLSA